MSSTEKGTAIRWIAANTLGWALAIETMYWLKYRLGLEAIWGWIACGAMIGASQWVGLHRRLPLAPAWWIAGTCFAWTVGNWAGEAHSSFFLVPSPWWAGIAGGTLAGLVQGGILWRQVSRPALWVPTATVSSTLGWMLGINAGVLVYDTGAGEAAVYLGAGAFGGAVIGLVSAPVLLLLLRHPKQRSENS